MIYNPLKSIWIGVSAYPHNYGASLGKGEAPVYGTITVYSTLEAGEILKKHKSFKEYAYDDHMSARIRNTNLAKRIFRYGETPHYKRLLKKNFNEALALAREAHEILSKASSGTISHHDNSFVVDSVLDTFSQVAKAREDVKAMTHVRGELTVGVFTLTNVSTILNLEVEPHFFNQRFDAPQMATGVAAKSRLLHTPAANPVTKEKSTLGNVIMELNDDAKWSFEEIADWLDALDINTKICSREELNK